jgi:hypothetical protein
LEVSANWDSLRPHLNNPVQNKGVLVMGKTRTEINCQAAAGEVTAQICTQIEASFFGSEIDQLNDVLVLKHGDIASPNQHFDHRTNRKITI